jgi:hypothetical protein
MLIFAVEPVSATCFINAFHHSLCVYLLYLYKPDGSVKCITPFGARQQLSEHVPATTNTLNKKELIVRNVVFCTFRILLRKRLPLWSSSQSSWLQTQRSRVPIPPLPDFLKIVGVERGPFSRVRIIEELLE